MFFAKCLKILKKHYEDAFCGRLLFLSLYGEQFCSQTIAMVLLGQCDFDHESKTIKSEAQRGREVDIAAFTLFVKGSIDIGHQMKDSNNQHMNAIKCFLPLLAGKH